MLLLTHVLNYEIIVVRGDLTYLIPEPNTLILAMFALFLRFPRRLR